MYKFLSFLLGVGKSIIIFIDTDVIIRKKRKIESKV